jgi:outer membrane protein
MRTIARVLLASMLALPGMPLAVAAQQGSASAPPPPAEADLAQCYAWAQEQSESLHMQSEQIYQVEQQYKQALAAALPNLSFNASEKWVQSSASLYASNPFLFQSPQPQVNFALSQPLFSGFREYAAMASFKHQGQSTELSLKRAHTLLFQDTANSFYLVLNLEAQLADARQAVDLSTARIKELRHFEDLGKSRHSEVTLVESQEASLESQVESLKGQIDVSRQVLSFLTGKDIGATKLTDRLERLRALDPEDAALGKAYDRTDVRSLHKMVEYQEDQVKLAKGAWLPTISFLGDYYTKRADAFTPIHWDAGISGSLPLFSGGGQLAAVHQAQSQLSQAQYNFSLAARQARSDIHTAYVTLRATLAGTDAAERAYLKADETYKLETKEYRQGLVNNLDVMTALNSMIAAKTTFDQIMVQMKLNYLQFKLSDEELP